LVKKGLVNIGRRKEVYLVIDKSIYISGNVEKSTINTGNHVKQTVTVNDENAEKAEKAFLDLMADITKIQDEDQRNLANYMVEQLKDAYKDGNPEKAKQPFGYIRGILGDLSAIITIAGLFGFGLS
jgi:hypothetical protein